MSPYALSDDDDIYASADDATAEALPADNRLIIPINPAHPDNHRAHIRGRCTSTMNEEQLRALSRLRLHRNDQLEREVDAARVTL